MKKILILFLLIFSYSFAKYEELYDVSASKEENGTIYTVNSKEKYSKSEIKMFGFTNPSEADKLYKYLDVNKLLVIGEKFYINITINQVKYKF